MQTGRRRGDRAGGTGVDRLVALDVGGIGRTLQVGRQGQRSVSVEVDHVVEADDALAVGEDGFHAALDAANAHRRA